MKCVRREAQVSSPGQGSIRDCERCLRAGRRCVIPPPCQLGRRPGSLGRPRGVGKAQRGRNVQPARDVVSQEHVQSRRGGQASESTDLDSARRRITSPQGCSPAEEARVHSLECCATPGSRKIPLPETERGEESRGGSGLSPTDPVSNSYGLLTEASIAAKSTPPENDQTSAMRESALRDIARTLIRRPGAVSLGLTLDRRSLEEGIESLFRFRNPVTQAENFFAYRKTTRERHVGPDLDPVDLGLISAEETRYLFGLYVLLAICNT